MKSILPATLALVVATLAACDADRPVAPDAAPVATRSPAGTDAPPAPGSGLAHFDGYGDMRFGMTEDEARAAWGGALQGEAGEGCHYLNPAWKKAPSYFAFMFDGGRFVRYDVGNDQEVAPGGGRRGMTEAQIDAAYPDRVVKSPHHYVDGGKYLRVKAGDGSDGALVFETDAGGKVSEWHAGLAPQVDWIEGCS